MPAGTSAEQSINPVEYLADDLALHPGDVRVVAGWMGARTDADVDTEMCGALRFVLDEFCVRSVPAFWWPNSDPDAGAGATRMTR
jgi:hypothetical protein